MIVHCYLCYILAIHPCAYGARSHLAPTALHLLWLLAASSEFPNEAHKSTALNRLRLLPATV